MSPRRETEQTLRLERQVADHLMHAKGWIMHKLPYHYSMDFAVEVDGSIVAFCEVKSRSFKWGRYSSVMLNAYKVLRAVAIKQTLKVPAYLAVMDTDGRVFLAELTNVNLLKSLNGKMVWGGQDDYREGRDDQEPVFKILKRFFKEVK